MTAAPGRRLSVLHVVIRATATNSQYNEHCLPMRVERRITVCSLLPSEVAPPDDLRLLEGDGSKRGAFAVLRRALDAGTYDIVHVHAPASGILVVLAYLLSRRSRADLVLTVHNSWPNFRLRNRLFLWGLIAYFPVVVACGHAARDSMPAVLRAFFGKRIHAVANGVDLDRVDSCRGPAGSAPRAGDGSVAAAVNRLIPIKEPVLLAEAFLRAARPEDTLVMVGEGPLKASMPRPKPGRPSVRLTGAVERDEVYRILWDADLFVSASRGEGLPVAVLEAMACECPVVLTDIPPHREIAMSAAGIRLVPPGDATRLSAELASLMGADPEQRRALGRQLRVAVEQNFSVRAMNQSYGEIYSDVLARTGTKDRVPLGGGAVASKGEPT
ncbi:MAG TPA: glycosyltransferase family 4 protein [Nocardioidaceae bacterium]|nr:glycosyltransferase family 4 protein [Nocardioidaceae bacterium]